MPPLDNSAEYANHIPEAVRRASERADDIAREIGVAGLPPVEGADPEPAADPAVEPTAVEPVAEPQPVVAPPVDDGWEQRYNTLQGKYNSDIASLRGQVASLERLLANVSETRPAPEPRQETTTTVVAPIPPEDIETYGEDLVKAVPRWVAPVVQPLVDKIASLEQHIERLQGGHQQLRTESVQDRVFNALDADPALAGRWRDTNQDPEFIAWLQEPDPFAGAQRMALLRHALDAGDAVRVARFFKTYIAEHTAVTQPQPAVADHTSPQNSSGTVERPTLESMASPGRAPAAGPASNGGAPEKRIWTTTQISAFYRDCAQGRYATREAEKMRLEADIFAAASEGRIR